jgi:SulP family sulfate permease
MEVDLDRSRRSPLLIPRHRPNSDTYESPPTIKSLLFSPPRSPASSRTPRRGYARYDVSRTMNRLRTNMGGKSIPTIPSLEAPESLHQNNRFLNALGQIPAIALIGMFHLMVGIPFGVSYFPMDWSPYVEEATEDAGPFPLPGKEALGIRMFLFSTIIGQVVFTSMSGFANPIGLQMIENVPFCHELASIVIKHQGYGLDAISTLIVMFGLSSIVVGMVFWVLGKYRLGRIVYFFPTHVLIGCIGGIGIFIAKTGIEVTIADTFSISNIIANWNLIWVVFAMEITLRILEKFTKDAQGKPKYTLLSPIYFCMITPIFYLGLQVVGVSVSRAEDAGYFFPQLDDDDGSSGSSGSIFLYEHLWDMWTVINLPTVSWAAVWDSLPTLLALTLFSLIHVPINIPAFALSTNTEADMNKELIAHGYSNMIAGLFGGLQNYMAYTQSVLYHKSGGIGKPSGIAVALVTTLLFFIGPTIASYIPRCMAGTLLLHVGLDLFLEGVWDSYGQFDLLEYSGIWLIVVIMTLNGMEAAMMAGVIAAVSTYAVQSVAYLSPIRGFMPGTTLRSSQINRSHQAQALLNSLTEGRSRILVIQLQGHLFFGNMAHFTESINQLMTRDDKSKDKSPAVVVIMDCSLVLGIDSSAAQAIAKLKDAMLKKYHVELCIFVTGSDQGFPTEFKLSDQLSPKPSGTPLVEEAKLDVEQVNEGTALLLQAIRYDEETNKDKAAYRYCGSHVCESLDMALTFAEDALICRQGLPLLNRDDEFRAFGGALSPTPGEANSSPSPDEKEVALFYLKNLCPIEMEEGDPEILFSLFDREVYRKDEYLWRQHDPSECVKLIVFGLVIAELENEAGTTETVSKGNLIGELGLVNGNARMSSVKCFSDEVIVYSMSLQSFETLIRTQPRIARYIDSICIRYLALRVQHVSNRIFETRCLPI